MQGLIAKISPRNFIAVHEEKSIFKFPAFKKTFHCCSYRNISFNVIWSSAQCLRMDLNKKSGSKQKTMAGSKGTP